MFSEKWYTVLSNISAFFVILPLSVAFLKSHLSRKVHLALISYLTSSLIAELVQYVLAENNIYTNVTVNVFSILEFAIISFLYFEILLSTSLKKTVAFSLVVISIVVTVCFFENLKSNMPFFTTSYTLLLIIGTLIFVKRDSVETSFSDKYAAMYPINAAFAIYFATSFFLFLFDGFILLSASKYGQTLYSIHLVNNFIFYLIFTYGLWTAREI
jgi:hypothetical protein